VFPPRRYGLVDFRCRRLTSTGSRLYVSSPTWNTKTDSKWCCLPVVVTQRPTLRGVGSVVLKNRLYVLPTNPFAKGRVYVPSIHWYSKADSTLHRLAYLKPLHLSTTAVTRILSGAQGQLFVFGQCYLPGVIGFRAVTSNTDFER
jgi:hypothetical protein